MSTAVLARPAAQSAVERYFEVSLYLLLLSGFVTLAGTGKLDVASLLLVSAALAARGYLLARRQTFNLSEGWTTAVTIFYIAFYAADFLFLSRSFVTASVHLVLFSMVVKIFSVQRDRDLLYLAVLSFLEVLAAAVLTVDIFFVASFAVFLLLAVTTFISLEMVRTGRRAGAVAREHTGIRRMGRVLSITAMLLVVGILTGGVVIFFVLPRLSANYLASFAGRNPLATGFSEEVELGQIGVIQQSNEVVMHVRVHGDTTGQYGEMYWRGLALAVFDGTRWSNPTRLSEEESASGARRPRMMVLQSRTGSFDLRELAARQSPVARSWQPMRYRVLMEPLGTRIFFIAGQPQILGGGYRMIGIDPALSIYNLDSRRPVSTYEVVANASAPMLRESLERTIPPGIALLYLQAPPVDARVRQLAQQVTANASTDYDKARLVEEYLRSQFGYTLELPAKVPADPIANFLFERKRGHCEYFASSMAVMLRTLGIPSRVVNGFRGGEFNPVTGSYMVRARDAHSWVEAYFPGSGWLPFDPTPAAPRPVADSLTGLLYYVDAVREFWREWVINYDLSHQTSVSSGVVRRTRSTVARWRWQVQRWYEELLKQAERAQEKAAEAPQEWGAWGALGVAALALLVNARRIVQAIRTQRLARAPERAPQQAASIWYERMTRAVARRGYPKRPAQTPHEFVVTIEDPRLRRRVEEFTRAYERARFAESPDDAKKLPELYEVVRSKE